MTVNIGVIIIFQDRIMKTLRLSVLDRLMLPQLLPQTGGKLEMLIVNSIVNTIEFTAQDRSDFGLKEDNGNVSWASGGEADFEFTPEQVEVLKNAARRADDEKKVTRQNLWLIEKIDALVSG